MDKTIRIKRPETNMTAIWELRHETDKKNGWNYSKKEMRDFHHGLVSSNLTGCSVIYNFITNILRIVLT